MWRRNKINAEEVQALLDQLDVKLANVKSATEALNRAAIASGTAEKQLKATIERAEAANARLRRSTQGR